MNYIISIFLGMFLFGTFIEGLSIVKNIGLYGSILFFIIELVKNKKYNYGLYYQSNKLLFNTLFIFLIIILISGIFAYSDIKPSLREFRVEFLNIGIFMIISLFVTDRKFLFKSFIYFIILAFVYDVIRYGVIYYQGNPNLDFSVRLKRNFANYFELLYPFILGVLLIIKSRYKYLLMFILLVGFVELLLTGTRGVWVSVTMETIIFIGILLYIRKDYIKKIAISFGIVVVLIMGMGVYIYNHSNLFKSKIKQGIQPNGRAFIVETRLPIFLKYGNPIIGIGGPGNYQYNKILNNYKAPRRYGYKDGKNFHYSSDEPYLLQMFYKEGILGLLSFLLLSGVLLWKGLVFLKSNNKVENKLFLLSIITSYIGYYLVRGLVEVRELKYILIYITLFLITKENKND